MIWEVIPVALVTAVLSTLATLFLGERRMRRDYRLEFAAERVARELMLDKQRRRDSTMRPASSSHRRLPGNLDK